VSGEEVVDVSLPAPPAPPTDRPDAVEPREAAATAGPSGPTAGAVEVEALTKTFGRVVALDDVELSVAPGEVHGLIGPNGAGKSTLLRILFGLARPDRGRAALFGREHAVHGTTETLRGVAGFVDRPRFYPFLSGRQNLELLARVDGAPDAGRVDEVLETTRLSDAGSRKVGGWSTGMRQRLGLAAALLRRPRLLLLDEPTTGLDPAGARDLSSLIRSLRHDGVTVLLSSHDMAGIDALCDSASILNRGRVLRRGSIGELRASAPAGRHRLETSDDDAALEVGRRHPVTVDRHERGGLALQAGRKELHDFVCELGRLDISVVLLEQEVPPLAALFYELVDA
jgi:ABC-2 type transport system ATP-binding protein